MAMPFLDILRTRYVALPRPMRRGLGLAFRLLPPGLRYGPSFGSLGAEIARSRVDADFVYQTQTQSLRAVLSSAWQGSRYFRGVIAERLGGFDAIASADPQSLAAMPVLTRKMLSDLGDDLLMVPPGKADLLFTSGSSGQQPARIWLDRDRSVREMAFVHSFWGQTGYATGQRLLVVRDGTTFRFSEAAPWEFDPGLNELRLSPYHMSPRIMDLYLQRIAQWQPRLIYGLPSALSILAAHALYRGWRAPAGIAAVFTSSETLFMAQRRLIAEAFGGVPVLSHYGLTERCAFAAEVPGHPEEFEFEPLYGLTELLDDDDQPVTRRGDVGRIIATGFLSRAMGLVRYDTGDRARLVHRPTQENCWRLRVSSIRSKWSQEYVVGQKGNPVSVLNLMCLSYFGVIRDFQFYQDKPGHAVLRIVHYDQAMPADLARLVADINGEFGEILEVRLEPVAAIATGANGKRRLVDQRLPLPFGWLCEI